jgi:nicotinamidase/pyrazinamidase
MIEGPLIFVDVDTQRDFMEPAGALYIEGSEAILPNLARLTNFARSRGIPILATACAHEEGDPELERFARHCMVGTPGQQRVPETAWPGGAVLPVGEGFPGPLPPHLTLEKREFSPFSRDDADEVFARYEAGRPTFVVYGVATDYCVRAAAEGLLARGDRVALVVDAIRPIDLDGEAAVLEALVARGALMTLTDVVCGA